MNKSIWGHKPDTIREAVMRTRPGQSHQLIRARESARQFIPARLSDWGPVSWETKGKREKPETKYMDTQT